MNRSVLSERDICTKFITPAVQAAGWDVQRQIREEVAFTAGRVIVRGKMISRGKSRRVDYMLYHQPNLPLAIIEAKDATHSVGAGMQQALSYAAALDVPFVFSSNGDGFLFHDRTGNSSPVEQELALEAFPSPEDLWARYRQWKGLTPSMEDVVSQEYYTDASGKAPRYYQQIAINRAVEAIVKGQDRALLVMATGTGKTYTAFQIIWRLWKAGVKKRILFLADRNILVDQTKTNDFKPFGQAMTKITNRTIDKSFEIYLSLYQAVTGSEEERNIYREFTPDFFDLVVIDECHRGSAAENSAWREILDYFSSATHLGLTATPKETEDVSNTHYFGEPIYTYSLKQGIDDGFLAPYKVVRIDFDRDLLGWRPEEGRLDDFGREIADRTYNQRDIDRNLVLGQRTQLVAKKITEYLKGTDRYSKTIVFCEDIEHAERMRQALVNENEDLAADNPRYVVRITGDSPDGKMELDHFIDPESRYPVIATTSELMTTGVDAQTCKLIVLDQRIQSMTKFKQIIGRGSRLLEAYGKFYFTILDFKKATELFSDEGFDGPPEQIYQARPDEDPVPPDPIEEEPPGDDTTVIVGPGGDDEDTTGVRYYVGDLQVTVLAERVQYLDPKTGKLITESLKDYTRRALADEYASLDDFLNAWSLAERKQAILSELQDHGVLFEPLADEVGREYDPFDLICHVAFDRPPLTRRERAEQVKKRDYFTRYGAEARAVLEALLEKYADEGLASIEDTKVLRVQPLSDLGTPIELVRAFGGREGYEQAIHELEAELYTAA